VDRRLGVVTMKESKLLLASNSIGSDIGSVIVVNGLCSYFPRNNTRTYSVILDLHTPVWVGSNEAQVHEIHMQTIDSAELGQDRRIGLSKFSLEPTHIPNSTQPTLANPSLTQLSLAQHSLMQQVLGITTNRIRESGRVGCARSQRPAQPAWAASRSL
jgi:hypothetical protein